MDKGNYQGHRCLNEQTWRPPHFFAGNPQLPNHPLIPSSERISPSEQPLAPDVNGSSLAPHKWIRLYESALCPWVADYLMTLGELKKVSLKLNRNNPELLWTSPRTLVREDRCQQTLLCNFSWDRARAATSTIVYSFSRVQLFSDPMDCSPPGSSAMGFSMQEYWSGLPFPSPRDLPDPELEPMSPALAGGFFTTEPPGKPRTSVGIFKNKHHDQFSLLPPHPKQINP